MELVLEITRHTNEADVNLECYLSSDIRDDSKLFVPLANHTRAQRITLRCKESSVDYVHSALGVIAYKHIKPIYANQPLEGNLKKEEVTFTRKQVIGQQILRLGKLLEDGKERFVEMIDPTRYPNRIVREKLGIRCLPNKSVQFSGGSRAATSSKNEIVLQTSWNKIMDVQVDLDLIPYKQEELDRLFTLEREYDTFVRQRIKPTQPRYRLYHFPSWTTSYYLPISFYTLHAPPFTDYMLVYMIEYICESNHTTIENITSIITAQQNDKTNLHTGMLDVFSLFQQVCCLASWMCDYYPDLSPNQGKLGRGGEEDDEEEEVEEVIPLLYANMGDCEELGTHPVHIWRHFMLKHMRYEDYEEEEEGGVGEDDYGTHKHGHIIKLFAWVASLFVGVVLDGAASFHRTLNDNVAMTTTTANDKKEENENANPNGPDNYQSHVPGALIPRKIFMKQMTKESRFIENKPSFLPFEDQIHLPLIMEGTNRVYPYLSPRLFFMKDTRLGAEEKEYFKKKHSQFVQTDKVQRKLDQEFSNLFTLSTTIHPFVATEVTEFDFSHFYRRVCEMWTPYFFDTTTNRGHFEVTYEATGQYGVSMMDLVHAPEKINYVSCVNFTSQDRIDLISTTLSHQIPTAIIGREGQRQGIKYILDHPYWKELHQLEKQHPFQGSNNLTFVSYFVNHVEKLAHVVDEVKQIMNNKDKYGCLAINVLCCALQSDLHLIEIQLQTS